MAQLPNVAAMHSRLYIKMSQIAKMRITGIKDVHIAANLNITNSGLQRILRLQEYKDLEEAELEGHLSKMDEKLAGRRELLEAQWRQAVPVAVRGILEVAMQKRDLRAALAAHKEILDRDPDKIFAAKSVSTDGQGPSLPKGVIMNAAEEANKTAAQIAMAKPVDLIQ